MRPHTILFIVKHWRVRACPREPYGIFLRLEVARTLLLTAGSVFAAGKQALLQAIYFRRWTMRGARGKMSATNSA